jgi:hypothetical protein
MGKKRIVLAGPKVKIFQKLKLEVRKKRIVILWFRAISDYLREQPILKAGKNVD